MNRSSYQISDAKLKYQVLGKSAITPREQVIIDLLMTGACNKDIASELGISEETVKRHISHIFDKLGVFSRLELVVAYIGQHINDETAKARQASEAIKAELRQQIEDLRLENARLRVTLAVYERDGASTTASTRRLVNNIETALEVTC